MRRVLLVTFIAVVITCGAVVWAQPRTLMLAVGRMTGSETTENDQCLFPIGQGAVVMLHPSGEPCRIAREFVGTTGKLIWVPD